MPCSDILPHMCVPARVSPSLSHCRTPFLDALPHSWAVDLSSRALAAVAARRAAGGPDTKETFEKKMSGNQG